MTRALKSNWLELPGVFNDDILGSNSSFPTIKKYNSVFSKHFN